MMKRQILSLMILSLVCCGLFTGCAHTRPKPQLVYDRDGDIRQYKRYEPHPEMNYFNRWVRKAYRVPKDSDFDFNLESQADIIRQWGKPDYIRKPFRSLQNEKIEEWVYIEYQTVMQFVAHELVFEGPLTDYEQILIRKGYPNQATVLIGETGIERQSLVYYGWLPGRVEMFNLTNGWIAHSQEGN